MGVLLESVSHSHCIVHVVYRIAHSSTHGIVLAVNGTNSGNCPVCKEKRSKRYNQVYHPDEHNQNNEIPFPKTLLVVRTLEDGSVTKSFSSADLLNNDMYPKIKTLFDATTTDEEVKDLEDKYPFAKSNQKSKKCLGSSRVRKNLAEYFKDHPFETITVGKDCYTMQPWKCMVSNDEQKQDSDDEFEL